MGKNLVQGSLQQKGLLLWHFCFLVKEKQSKSVYLISGRKREEKEN